MTKEVNAVIRAIRNIPSLRNVPENTLMVYIAIAAGLAVFFFVMLWLLTGDRGKSEHGHHKDTDTHKMIMDLQQSLLNELRGTTKQNKTMINLTIIFIVITIVGIIASVFGGQQFMVFVKKIWAQIMPAIQGVKLPGAQ